MEAGSLIVLNQHQESKPVPIDIQIQKTTPHWEKEGGGVGIEGGLFLECTK